VPQPLHHTETSVAVDASTVDLAGEDLVVEFEPEWTGNGLVEADPDGDGARILCGQEIGTILVTAQLWDAAPTPDIDGWQDVAEVSTAWRSAFMDFGTTDEGDNPACRLDLPGPGDYRIRVHGTNRDDGDPRTAADPIEHYLIQVWPAPAAPPVIHKAASAYGARWRRA
jgi:hypothetical protein